MPFHLCRIAVIVALSDVNVNIVRFSHAICLCLTCCSSSNNFANLIRTLQLVSTFLVSNLMILLKYRATKRRTSLAMLVLLLHRYHSWYFYSFNFEIRFVVSNHGILVKINSQLVATASNAVSFKQVVSSNSDRFNCC